jgi:hypothetical protein
MRIATFIPLVLFAFFANGQDPTVPSQEIASRMKGVQRQTETPVSDAPTILKLRAIVLLDLDHGMAIVECDGRRFRITLDRTSIAARTANANAVSPLESIPVQGKKYFVEDFSSKAIALSDGNTTILIQ